MKAEVQFKSNVEDAHFLGTMVQQYRRVEHARSTALESGSPEWMEAAQNVLRAETWLRVLGVEAEDLRNELTEGVPYRVRGGRTTL